jgi:UDP-glucose 4-epimerase
VLEACRRASVERFLYASSVYVFSTKGAFYGASKKASELLVEEYRRQYNLNYTILRYGSVYGERADDTNRIYRLLREALTERRITFLGNGLEEREYIHGRDAARLSADVLAPEYCNANVMLTGGERYRYTDLLQLIREILDSRVEIALLDQEYKGHYQLTPYTFAPSIGKKLVSNPSVDFGQGLLECIQTLCHDLNLAGELPAAAED